MLNSLLIIIPAWNEAEVIGSVLEELTDFYPDAQVLVVSDGSTDATAQVARDHGAKVLELPYNLGWVELCVPATCTLNATAMTTPYSLMPTVNTTLLIFLSCCRQPRKAAPMW